MNQLNIIFEQEFFEVPGFPNHVINRDGVVKRLGHPTRPSGQTRKGRKRYIPEYVLHARLRSGYPSVSLRLNKKTYDVTVHRLLALVFIPNPLNKPFVNHKNGIKTDSLLENLEWVTPSENNIHAMDTGLTKSGSQHRWAKLSESDVITIRNLHSNGVSGAAIARQYNVYKNTIYHIISGRNWRRLTHETHNHG